MPKLDDMLPEPAREAREHRDKIFGLISVENVIQTVTLLVPLVAVIFFLARLSDSVESIRTAQILTDQRTASLRADVDSHTGELALHASQLSDQSAKTAILFSGRDEDRKTLNQLNTNVGILLDRTDPKK